MRGVPVAHITSLGDGVERWKPLENAAIDRLRRVVPVPRCAATRHFWHSAGPVVPARALAPFVSGACRAGQKDAPWGCAAIAPAPAAQHAAPLLPADSERASESSNGRKPTHLALSVFGFWQSFFFLSLYLFLLLRPPGSGPCRIGLPSPGLLGPRRTGCALSGLSRTAFVLGRCYF